MDAVERLIRSYLTFVLRMSFRFLILWVGFTAILAAFLGLAHAVGCIDGDWYAQSYDADNNPIGEPFDVCSKLWGEG